MRFEKIKNPSRYGDFGYKLYSGDTPVGKLYYDIVKNVNSTREDANTLIITYIVISQKYRGLGYAKAAIIKLMKKKYSEIRTTTVAKSNAASRGLFKSLGFTERASGKQLIMVYKK